jgi:GNAT superfamily N-acetyltransferase
MMDSKKAIQVRAISSPRDRQTFLTFPWYIYQDDPLWVPPIVTERAKVIDPERGPFFKRGEAECFVAWRDGKPVGTICAGEDRHTNAFLDRKDCVFGFFETIEDYAVAQALLDHAIAWANARDLEALYGPFNLDYEDSYGVLVQGRDRPPVILCGHTPPYYQQYLERFGFLPTRGDNLAFAVDIAQDTKALRQLAALADRIRKRKTIVIRQANMEDWDAEVDRVFSLINVALAHLDSHMSWHRDALEGLLAPFRDLADPELILFADVDGRSVGFFPGIPNWNETLIHANGLRHPWDYFRLWWHARRQPECLAIKSVLVLPEYWNTGVAVLLFDEMLRRARARGFKWIDLSLTSEDNPASLILARRMGGRIYKRYRVYRYAF